MEFVSFYFIETMSCTFQSAFQRQLFIKTFSGTYNNEKCCYRCAVCEGWGLILQCRSFLSCDLFLTSVFKLVMAKPLFLEGVSIICIGSDSL